MKAATKQRILDAYYMFDDDDISTERLLSMICDHCKLDITTVISALKPTSNSHKKDNEND